MIESRTMSSGMSRRDLLRAGGALIVGSSIPLGMAGLARAQAADTLPPGALDSYIAVDRLGRVTAFFGKVDVGQGLDVGIAQIVAEELDVALDTVDVIMGDSALTVNQGGASGAFGIELGAKPMRNAAAEARRVLVGLASEKLGVPADTLSVVGGVVRSGSDPSRTVSYADLIGGGRFDTALDWNGVYGNMLDAAGSAAPKPPDQYKIVGTDHPRPFLSHVFMGDQEYIVDIKLPGMVHGRVVSPPVAGAVPASVDDGPIRDIAGAKAIRIKDWLAVVADTEWGAIKAAGRLAVTWTRPDVPPFPEQATLYDHIREAPVTTESAGGEFDPVVPVDTGAFDAAVAGAARVVEAEYEFPFQSHASMAGACAVVDFRVDTAVLYTSSQKPHYAAEGVAKILEMPEGSVHAIWLPGPGSYGRNDAGDICMDAALLSKAVGKPVRVQNMRAGGTAWDPKAPASVHFAKAALDGDGNVSGYRIRSKGFSSGDIAPAESDPGSTMAGMLLDWPNSPVPRFDSAEEKYAFPAKVKYWQTIPALMQRASPLRTGHLRDPLGPQNHFASESFVDELAYGSEADPVEFRLRHLTEPRDVAVIEAAAERAGWQPRRAGPTAPLPASGTVSGRGIAYTRLREIVCAVVAFIDIDLDTGMIYPRKFVVAADQGLIINPLWLKRTIEGNIVMGCSRSLIEEVTFSTEMVTSADWFSYPILDMDQAPREIDIVLNDRPDLPPYGAGESTTRPVTPALANAVFDATGVRLRRAPLTAARVKAALDAREG